MPFLEPLPASTSHVSMRGRVQVCFWLACVFVCGGLCDLPCLLFRCVSWYFVTVGLVCFARPARAIFYLSVGVFSFDLFAFEHFLFPRFHFSVHLICVH